MLSQSNMKNKIVFAVAIGFLVAVAQCRPYPLEESSVSLEDKIALPVVPVDAVKEVEATNVVAVKEEVVAEAPKELESTILSVVEEVAADTKKSDEDAQSDIASMESVKAKTDIVEAKEEPKEIVSVVEVSTAAAVVADSEPAAIEPVIVAVLKPETADIVLEVAVEPMVTAVESEPEVKSTVEVSAAPKVEESVARAVDVSAVPAVEAVKSDATPVMEPLVEEVKESSVVQPVMKEVVAAVEPIITVIDIVVEPEAKSAPVEEIVAEEVPVVAINTKAIDAEEYVRSIPSDEKPSAVLVESVSKVIIVTPSTVETVPAEEPVVKVVVTDKVQEESLSEAAVSPVKETIVEEASEPKEVPVVATIQEAKPEEAAKVDN